MNQRLVRTYQSVVDEADCICVTHRVPDFLFSAELKTLGNNPEAESPVGCNAPDHEVHGAKIFFVHLKIILSNLKMFSHVSAAALFGFSHIGIYPVRIWWAACDLSTGSFQAV